MAPFRNTRRRLQRAYRRANNVSRRVDVTFPVPGGHASTMPTTQAPELHSLPTFEFLFVKKFISDLNELKSSHSINNLPYETMLNNNKNVYGFPLTPRRFMTDCIVEVSKMWHREANGSDNVDGDALVVWLLDEAMSITGHPAARSILDMDDIITMLENTDSGTLE